MFVQYLNSTDVAFEAYNTEPLSELLEFAEIGKLSLVVDATVRKLREQADDAVDLNEFQPVEAEHKLKALLRTEVPETHYSTYRLH